MIHDSPPQPLFASPWALRLGVVSVVGLLLVVSLAAVDRGRRAKLEAVTETTAVGDTAYFPLPPPGQLPLVGATIRGQPLYVVQAEPFEVRDTHTQRVEHDAARGLNIYELSAAASIEERDRAEKGRKGYLLKIAPNEYLKAQLAEP